SFLLHSQGTALLPAAYTGMKIRYSLSNWYDMRQAGAIYWETVRGGPINEDNKLEFTVIADGATHELTIALDESIVWSASDPIRTLRLDLGSRKNSVLKIELLEFY